MSVVGPSRDRLANVAELLASVATLSPGRPAVIRADGSVAWTFGSLAAAAHQGAAQLKRAGVGPGDRVISLEPRGDAGVAVAAAVLWNGSVLVVPPLGLGLLPALRAVGALEHRAVIAGPILWPVAALVPGLWRATTRFVTGRRPLPGLIALHGPEADPLGAPQSPVPCALSAPAVVTFTTGTTGEPRPITRIHKVLLGQHAALDWLRPPEPDDLDLAGVPMLVLHDLARGVQCVLPPTGVPWGRGRAADLASGAARLATTAAGFPALFDTLLRLVPAGGLPGLRAVHVGGGPVPRALVERLQAAAPNARIAVVYGATEAEPIAAIDADEWLRAADGAAPGDGICVGRLVPGLDIRLTPLLDSGDRSWGRLEVRGEQVAAPVDGVDGDWVDVGDLARVDGQGRLWLLGRAAHAVDGIAPLVIEQVIESIDGVRGAVVIQTDTRQVRRPTLVVEVIGGQRRKSVAKRVAAVVAERSWPLDVLAVERLPRDRRSGTKVDYGRLARMLKARIGEGGAAPQVR